MVTTNNNRKRLATQNRKKNKFLPIKDYKNIIKKWNKCLNNFCYSSLMEYTFNGVDHFFLVIQTNL